VDLRLGAALRLPPGRRARVLALALAEGAGSLGDLAREVEAVCRRLGHAPETRRFTAHLTLARARQGESLPPALTGALDAPPQPGWRASEVLLFESVLRPGGPEYRRRQRFPLGGDAAPRKDGSTA
jgi:2'-5' RNA ligase